MRKLLKIELERALKNKWFYICLLIGFAIVAKDTYSVAYNMLMILFISFQEFIVNGW